jgi:predicted O-linked N-acetylglucosamine transferase (SPINDLY family)
MLGNLIRQVVRRLRGGALRAQTSAVSPAAADDLARGLTMQKSGRLKEAEAAYRRQLQREPENTDALHLLGHLLGMQHEHAAAVEILKRLVTLSPDSPDAQLSLGLAYKAQGLADEAARHLEGALRLRPSFGGALLPLAEVLRDLGQADRAEDVYRALLALEPQMAGAHLNLGVNLLAQGRLDEGMDCYRQALAAKPDAISAHTNLVYAMNFQPGHTPEEIFAAHREWAVRHAEPLRRQFPPADNERVADRRLRIGYVSPDFRNHSVCYFVEPLLMHHDASQVEVFCYSDVHHEDAYTRRLQTYRVNWRQTSTLSDEELFHAIRRDRIDILVDLAGHTRGNRLLVFARKAAPVQVTAYGYINTTGMSAIDYRLTDAHMDPPGTSEHCYSEKLARLPRIYMVFRPPPQAPQVNALPATGNGHITFGSYSGLFKISPDDLRTWAEILKTVPASRLKIAATDSERAAGRLRAFFTAQGIAADRIECLAPMPYERYLASHHDIDIALDSFPCNGVTTTVHSLWMGVPVVVRTGERCVSRAATSQLANLGLAGLIAQSAEAYRDIAVQLATDPDRLRGLRASLRAMMAKAPNTDGAGVTAELEKLYRRMWAEWCESPARNSGRGISE